MCLHLLPSPSLALISISHMSKIIHLQLPSSRAVQELSYPKIAVGERKCIRFWMVQPFHLQIVQYAYQCQSKQSDHRLLVIPFQVVYVNQIQTPGPIINI